MRSRSFNSDAAAGMICFLLAVGYVAASLRIPQASSASEVVGPRVLPVTIGVLLAAASAALAATGLRARSRGQDDNGVGPAGAEQAGQDPAGQDPAGQDPAEVPIDARRFLVVTLLLLGYVMAFIPLGYPLATGGFLLAVTTLLERHRWRRNLVYATVLPAVVFLLFSYGLRVQLPLGLLG
ncbi:MAG: tripartite tricarboxylate transporter TctB family protein [Carbonactinosporaceae bacterium]